MPTKTMINLAHEAPQIERREMTAAEAAFWDALPARTAAQRAASLTLSRAAFFARLSTAAALQPGEPRIVEWTRAQIEAAALPEEIRALYLDRIDTAVEFPRIDPEFGDVMTPLGALFGLSSVEVDDLFLEAPVRIDRAGCPLPTVRSAAATIAALEARLAALEEGAA